jgi:isopenicillin-N epimerase
MPSELARHWGLDPAITFLNHGSFGACPRPVLDVQQAWRDQLEAEPVRFLGRDLNGRLATVREALGDFVGADPDDLALVTNATGGANAVIRSLQFEAGDEIVTTDHEYNAILNVLRYVAERDGARVVVVGLPFPAISPDDVVERFMAAVTDRTRLAVISHVTSPTALILPVERIVPELAERGIDTLVDGAHAPGMVALDLDALGAAYYTANLHKWVCAPKGSAFLHVRRDRQAGVRPGTISHGLNAPTDERSRFRLEFDWQGTLDPTPWLAVPAAIDFIGGLVEGGWPAVMARNHELALYGRDALAGGLGGDDLGSPATMIGAMAALPLPSNGPLGDIEASGSSPLDTDPFQLVLYERFGIEVPIGAWPVPAVQAASPPIRSIRISAALHNDAADIDRLVTALGELSAGASAAG